LGVRIGCDIGGTFTDVMLVTDDGQTRVAKVPSTPDDFARGVLEGLDQVLVEAASRADRVDFLVHSTTIALNTLVERRGARVGLLTTEGFRDVLEIGRASRAHEYDLFQTRPRPLVPRRLRLTVRERMDHRGRPVVPLDLDGVRQAGRRFRAEGVETVAVCFLHAYANPRHEQAAREALAAELPECPVFLSSDVYPVYREYERTSTTVVNAYVAPRVIGYLEQLERALVERGYRCRLHVVQGSGGVMTSEAARRRCVHMLMAGPAAGVAAAAHVAKLAGYEDVVGLDIGGTTQLVSVAHRGKIRPSLGASVDGFPVRVPMVDVRAVGAGGGSLARVDAGGMLRVGPESAGADPGPACYGRGGREPTVTDAHVVLGHLDPGAFLGGRMRLSSDLAREAVERVGRPLGLDAVGAAAGILQVVDTARASSVRKLLIEHGLDPRDFSLVAFGGAGPVHAARLAREVGLARVIVPPHPGLASPLGALTGDLRRDHARTVGEPLDRVSMSDLARQVEELRREAETELAAEGVAAAEVELAAEMKYAGQLHETFVRLPELTFGESDRTRLAEAFYEEHRRLYGYAVEDETVTLANLRLVAVHHLPPIVPAPRPPDGPDPLAALVGVRPVHFGDAGWCRTSIYDRERLRPGNRVRGPAVVQELDSTTLVPPERTCAVDPRGNLVIEAAP
jgi:N-methylhydantoinase A